MGQNLCCMIASSDNVRKEGSQCDTNGSTPTSSVSSMQTDNEKRRLILPKTNSTLEECLMMASPPVDIGGATNDDQLQVVQLLYQKFQPSSPDVHTDFFTPRRSFSSSDKIGLLGKIDEEEDDQGSYNSTSPTSRGEKTKKRVSFRLPEAADIIIF